MTYISIFLVFLVVGFVHAANFQNPDLRNLSLANNNTDNSDFDKYNKNFRDNNETGGGKVLNGNSVTPHTFVFIAALYNNNNRGYSFTCGASIIGPRHLLTAAHCIEPLSRNGYHAVYVGLHDMRNQNENGRQLLYFKRSDATIHPQYNKRELVNDIAIIKVDGEIKLTPTVNKICLTSPQATATVSGWGRNSCNSQQTSSVLLQASGNVVENSDCEQRYRAVGANRRFPISQMCMDMGEQSSFNGDSGGPLFITQGGTYQQVGIVSGGLVDNRGCPILSASSYYTRVDQYRDFISRYVGKSTFCQ